MCTLSWIKEGKRRTFFFNRDESLSRTLEECPRVYEKAIYPVDPQGGGTWVGGNAFGLVLALLNHYPEPCLGPVATSRGQLVLRLLALKNVLAVQQELVCQSHAYAPFYLVASDDQNLRIWTWNGVDLFEKKLEPEWGMLSTSRFESEAVVDERMRLFGVLKERSVQALEAFHCGHDEHQPSPFSVCLHRDDAQTKSLCCLVMDQESLRFRYAPGRPCESHWEKDLCLRREVHV